jgi:peptidoglycan hydrolase-like protein with peptidoglycan-binding domain
MNLELRPMKPNTRNRDIVNLQEALRRLGFTISDADGFLGKTTLDSVRKFQRDQGITRGNRGRTESADSNR